MTIYNYLDGPCYRCLYPECPKASQMMSCRVDGVVGMAPGVTGQLLATQLLKLVLGLDSVLNKKLLIFNLLTDVYKVLKIRGRRNDCVACSPSNPKPLNVETYDYDEFTGVTCATAPTELHKDSLTINWSGLSPDKLASVKIIDVRPQEQFNICRIVSAPSLKNIPFTRLSTMSDEELKSEIGISSADEPVYVLCRAGVMSVKACNYLISKGIKTVNIAKGMNGYLKSISADFEV